MARGVETLSDLLRCTGSAAAWLRDGVESLEVDAERMAHNLAPVDDEMEAEAVSIVLARELGRSGAHEVVAAAVERMRAHGSSLRTELAADPAGGLDDL